MRLLAIVLLLASCAPHECERDADCPPATGTCRVEATSCDGDFIAACREYRCATICTCELKP